MPYVGRHLVPKCVWEEAYDVNLQKANGISSCVHYNAKGIPTSYAQRIMGQIDRIVGQKVHQNRNKEEKRSNFRTCTF